MPVKRTEKNYLYSCKAMLSSGMQKANMLDSCEEGQEMKISTFFFSSKDIRVTGL